MKASEFANLIPQCCSEVLDTMYFTTVLGSLTLESLPEPPPDGENALTFSLDFVGDISGRFGVHLEQTTARNLAANFLGESDIDVSAGEVAEVTGELANMLCGSVMSQVEGEHSFSLSHPEAGEAAPSGPADVLVSVLETDSGVITIWIQVEGNQCLS